MAQEWFQLMVDYQMEAGYGTIPPVSPDAVNSDNSKFREDPLTMIDLIKFGTVNVRLAAMMWV